MFTWNTQVEIILIFIVWESMDCSTDFSWNQIIPHVEEISKSLSLAQLSVVKNQCE